MSYSFVVTTYNDSEDAVRMYRSLVQSIDGSFGFYVIDGGSTPEHLKILNENLGEIVGPHNTNLPLQDLSVALNAGIYRALGYYPDGSNIQEFIKSVPSSDDYIFWIHTDCRFFQNNWAKKLCEVYEFLWTNLGVFKLSPGTSNIDSSIKSLQDGNYFLEGNNCPWVMNAEAIHLLVSNFGHVFNPEYKNIGGCEDIENWLRIKELGGFAGTCPLVDVWHHGAGIRFRRDTSKDQMDNRSILHNNFGDSCVNHGQLGPECSFDLTEINQQLGEKFADLKNEVLSLTKVRDSITKSEEGRYYKR